uniref:DCD domain-containing protein n=3 Tax=Oryza TaxID=4527 RepID=A0A0E0PU63_ORYRU
MAAVEEEGRWEPTAAAAEEEEMGVEAEEAMEDGEVEGEVGQQQQEEEGNGDAGKSEEHGSAGGRMVWKKKHHHHHQPRTPVAAESRATWRGGKGSGKGRGGGGGGGGNLQPDNLNRFNKPGVYGGAIIICNHMTKRGFFEKKLFGLPGYAATFIKKIRVGMLLFVFELGERKLYGVFEATSNGALDILPNAFTSLRKPRPAQVLFRRIWFCKPLAETEFSSAIKGNCLYPQMSFFGISYQQVLNLVHLFASKRIELQPYQKPKSRVIYDYKISLAHLGREFSPRTHNKTFSSHSSSTFCNNRFSLPRSSYLYTKQNAKHDACKYESPLHSPLKSVIFKAPDVKGESLEPNPDYIPLELDDSKSDSDADPSDSLETVSFYPTLEGCISYEDQDLKPFNGKFNGDDGHHSHVLIRGLNSECETDRNSVFSRNVKERQSSLAKGGKGCKRKAIVEFDEQSSPRRGCTMKRVSFSFSGEEISVTSEKSLHRPTAFAELPNTRESSAEEGKQEVGCVVQKARSKGEDVSAKIKLMGLSLPEALRTNRVHSCSSNSQSLVTQTDQKRAKGGGEETTKKQSHQELLLLPSIISPPHCTIRPAAASIALWIPMNFRMGKAHSKEGSTYDGAIFLCNRLTRRECFEKKLFGLYAHCADFIQKVKVGATLFLYDTDQHKLHGIRFKRIWFCKPLMESELHDAIQNNFTSKNKLRYGLSHQQVVRLLHLFSSRNRLQPRQNQNLQDELPKESEMSSLVNQTDIQSSSNSSSHGSFKSPCQTCSSSTHGERAATLSHKLADPMPLMHRGLKPYTSGAVKSKDSSRFPLHIGANTDIVTVPVSQEAMDDRSSDDYIPLPQEENTLEGIDDLSDLLEDESYSSESQGTIDSEEHGTFHQACAIKEDECYPPVVNFKLRSDSEGRSSVFSRLLGKPRTLGPRKKSSAKAFPSMSSGHLPQRKKQWRKKQSKPFPCDRDGVLGTHQANKLRRIPALDYSFVWDDGSRSTNSFGRKPSDIQTSLELCEHGNKWDMCTKEHSRSNEFKRLFVPEAIRKLIRPYDKELSIPPVFPGVHDGNEVNSKEEVNDSSLDLKRRGKDDQDFGDENDNVEEATWKKRRLADASFSQEEYLSGGVLVPKGTEDMDMLAISDGNCKDKSICLSPRDTCAEMARACLQTKVVLQDEQQKNIQDCCEEVAGVTSLILEHSESMDLLPKRNCRNMKTCLNIETKSQVASGNLETRSSLEDTQKQSVRSCHGVINGDKILLMENFETMDVLPNHDEDCLAKSTFVRNDSNHLETEMPMQEKQSPSVQNCCEALHGDNMLIQEKSENMLYKIDADSDCGKKKSVSFDKAYSNVAGSSLETHVPMQEPLRIASSCCEIVNADQVCAGEVGKNSFSLDENGGYVTCPCNTTWALENAMAMDTVESIHGDIGNNSNNSAACRSMGSDYMEEVHQLVTNCSEISAAIPESSGTLNNFAKCCGDSANKNSLLDQTSENVSTDHQEVSMLPQDQHYHSCSGDTSSALEYSDTNAGDGDSEHRNSFDQKGGESMYPVTGVLLQAEQHQKLQGEPESSSSHEISNSGSFVVCAEDSRSKSGLSADRMVTDLETNSESRTGFFNTSSSECGENFSASASSSENAQQKLSGSAVSAEVARLQHDPGE